MSSQPRTPAPRPAIVALCLLLLATGFACFAAATANAAQYKALLCAGNVGANAFGVSQTTAHFNVENYCDRSAPDPAGDAAFMRLVENQPGGNMAHGAYVFVHWDAPPFVHFKTAGGWTRQPGSFNDGWRSRFWGINVAHQGFEILSQGNGLGTTPHFAPHLWPGWGADFWRFAFEMTCVRPAGCDRAGWNGTELNTINFTLNDDQDAQVAWTDTTPLMRGGWVRGPQAATWDSWDNGSGLRFQRFRVDGHLRHVIDNRAHCNLASSAASGEYARVFQPCPIGGPYSGSFVFDTAGLGDGVHTIQACAQDYGQAVGMNGTGSESCVHRHVFTDNTAPGAPVDLRIISANPARYLSKFDAAFSLPPNQGSPIARIHYAITDPAGKVLVPAKVLTGTNPSALRGIEGPKAPGDYRLRVQLEDAVGLVGPAASVPIPRDTTPPAAPQRVSVTPPSVGREQQGFDVRWQNIVDQGSPINVAHYEVLDANGKVVVPMRHIGGERIESIATLDTPRESGGASLRLWLSDEEGNVGAPVTAPLAYDCQRSEVAGGQVLSAGLGEGGGPVEVVKEGQGSTLSGELRSGNGGVEGAALCVFSTVVTDDDSQFAGISMTGKGGRYQFTIPPGPSRNLGVMYRGDQRQITASATVQTRLTPVMKLRKRVVRNMGYATFSGTIPGPHSDNVLIVLQVKSGDGWRAFRRYRTRDGGHFKVRYRFTQTNRPTTYVFRVQVRVTPSYPYLEGSSRGIPLRVVP